MPIRGSDKFSSFELAGPLARRDAGCGIGDAESRLIEIFIYYCIFIQDFFTKKSLGACFVWFGDPNSDLFPRGCQRQPDFASLKELSPSPE